MTVEDRLARLEARVAVLDAEREIIRTLHQYGHAWDYGPDEARLDCFTDDGVFHLSPQRLVDAPAWSARGQKELFDKWISHHAMAPEAYMKHLFIEPKIELKGETEASVESMFGVFFNRGGAPCIAAYGRYLDRMVRCADGRWRLKARTAELEAADMPKTGFAKGAAGLGALSLIGVKARRSGLRHSVICLGG